MAFAIGLWSISLAPSQSSEVIPQRDIRITQVALGDELADASARNSIKISYMNRANFDGDGDDDDDDDDEEGAAKKLEDALTTTVLCSLTAGKIEQATVDLILDGDEEYIIKNVGKNTVYLTGNYIDQMPPDSAPFDSDSDEDEYDFDLRDVSSDVEVMGDGMDTDGGRFEEVHNETEKKSLKHPRESEVSEKDGQAQPKLSKAEKKRLKKLKAESGAAVAVDADAKKTQAGPKDQPQPKKEKEKKKDASATSESKPPPPKASGPTQELPGGVKIVDSKKGTGPEAKKGNTVSMRYIGKLQNGKIFDQNTKGKPFTFHLGSGEVIKGWDVGIAGMQVGGERLLTIPPAMAYGKRNQKEIPANSTLVFEVKLLEIK